MNSSDPNKNNKNPSEKITENCEENEPEKFIHETVLNKILNKIDVKEKSNNTGQFQKNVSNAETNKKLITFDHSIDIYINTSSLLTGKQDKASGPGIIFSADGKSVFNFNKKCPPVPYCESFVGKTFPETEMIVYEVEVPGFLVPLYDGAGQRLPQAVVDGDISRRSFLFKVMLILFLHLIYVSTFILCCIYIESLGNFVKNPVLDTAMLLLFVTFLFLIWSWEPLRKTKPFNYIVLGMCTFFSAFVLGYENITLVVFLQSLIGTITILVVFGLLSCLMFYQLSARSDRINIVIFLNFIFLLFVIALIDWWLIGIEMYRVYLYLYTMLYILLLSIIFDMLYTYQVILGRKGRYAMKTDEHISAAAMFYFYIYVYLWLLPQIIRGPYVIGHK